MQESLPVEISEAYTDLGHPYYEWLVKGHGHNFQIYTEWYATQRIPECCATSGGVF